MWLLCTYHSLNPRSSNDVQLGRSWLERLACKETLGNHLHIWGTVGVPQMLKTKNWIWDGETMKIISTIITTCLGNSRHVSANQAANVGGSRGIHISTKYQIHQLDELEQAFCRNHWDVHRHGRELWYEWELWSASFHSYHAAVKNKLSRHVQ